MTLIWNWPQIVWAVLAGAGLLFAAVMNGEPRTGNVNFAVTLVVSAAVVVLLYSGGFWAGASP